MTNFHCLLSLTVKGYLLKHCPLFNVELDFATAVFVRGFARHPIGTDYHTTDATNLIKIFRCFFAKFLTIKKPHQEAGHKNKFFGCLAIQM